MRKLLFLLLLLLFFSLTLPAYSLAPKTPEKKASDKIDSKDKKASKTKDAAKVPSKKTDPPKALPQGTLAIETTPEKAEIYSDGKLLGVTPGKIQISAGDFKLYLYKENHIIKVLKGKLKAGETLTFKSSLPPDVTIPHGINLKYAAEFVKDRKEAMGLLQRVFIYLGHFHVDAPKEPALILGGLRTLVEAVNKIKLREELLKKELSAEDMKSFYVADIDLTRYPLIDMREKDEKGQIDFSLRIPGNKLEVSVKSASLTSCFKGFQKVYDFLRDSYDTQKKIGDNGLFYIALQGMLGVLHDPHTRLIPPRDLKEMNMEVEGQFGGLGIVISQVNGILTVITPMDGTPAAKMGILEGDKIVKIEGQSTQGWSLLKAIKQLRGKDGTKVTITIQRGALQQEITLTRAIIKIKYVKARMLKEGIGLIRLSSFMGKKVPEQIQGAIEKLQKQGMKALILDLRNNPGGLLDNAQKVASFFLDKGDLVVYTKGRNPLYNETLKTDPQYIMGHHIPLVVLINKGSASASEIVGGALQDYKKALLVGETSYGKGSVQRVFPVPDMGMAFAITIAKYYLPKGRCIHKVGVTPDYIRIHSLLTKLKIRARSVYKKKEEDINDLHMKLAMELLHEKLAAKKMKKEKLTVQPK